MNNGLIIFLALFIFILIILFFLFRKKARKPLKPFPETYRGILTEHVDFYNHLDSIKKKEFENRMQLFLLKVRITGIKTTVEDVDKVLIAAAAIIPVFSFANWEYLNLHEVLLYPEAFDKSFDLESIDRNFLGMVGDGPYQHIMILSKPNLREGFANKDGKHNTAIHEFVHLIDKTDGIIDGVPTSIMSKQYVQPWLNCMQREINQILNNNSDINSYGAKSPAEFFAVAAEYFFERPDLLQINHPELYNLLSVIFVQHPKKQMNNS